MSETSTRRQKATGDTLDAHVRRRIKARLADLPAKPTQDAIGQALGKTQTWVSHNLAGDLDADFETAGRFCEFLGTTLSAEIKAGADAKAKPTKQAEFNVLFSSITPDEQNTVMDILRTLARRPASRRARGGK